MFYKYAVERGVNVFMEKPVTADGYGTKQILEINKMAKQKNLKVGVGLMCRHSRARGARDDGHARRSRLAPSALSACPLLASVLTSGALSGVWRAAVAERR